MTFDKVWRYSLVLYILFGFACGVASFIVGLVVPDPVLMIGGLSLMIIYGLICNILDKLNYKD